jgi:putative Mn2+ efflux pump MntP
MLVIVLLAISVSLDTLGIGMAYAMTGIRIPRRTRIVVALLNGFMTGAAVCAGETWLCAVPDRWFRLFGSAILIALGVKMLVQSRGKAAADYDRDASHTIDLKEGCVLGFAMALDSSSAGFGIVGKGVVVYTFPILSALLSSLFLWIGEKHACNVRWLNGLGGVILMILGVLRICPGIF